MVQEKKSYVTVQLQHGITDLKNAKFKDDLLDLIGGSSHFDFLIISFCERIQEDPRLAPFYGNFDLKSLTSLQKELLLAAFLNPESKDDLETWRNRVVIRHHRLFDSGLNANHFDMLQEHLLDSVRDCWLSHEVLTLCKKYFGELRYIFLENGKRVFVEEVRHHNEEDLFSQSMRHRQEDVLGGNYDRLSRSEQTYGALKAANTKREKKKVDVPFWRRKPRTNPSSEPGQQEGIFSKLQSMSTTKKQKQSAAH